MIRPREKYTVSPNGNVQWMEAYVFPDLSVFGSLMIGGPIQLVGCPLRTGHRKSLELGKTSVFSRRRQFRGSGLMLDFLGAGLLMALALQLHNRLLFEVV